MRYLGRADRNSIAFVVLLLATFVCSPACAEKVWVAVGYGGRRMVSNDAIHWTITDEWFQPGGDDSNNLMSLVHANGKFVAVGGGGGGKTGGGHVLVSADGRKWRETWEAPVRINPIVFGNDRFLVGGPDQQLYLSDDAEAWTGGAKLTDRRCTHFRQAAFGNGVFVVTGNHGGDSEAWICVTKDGKSILNVEFDIANIRDIHFANGKFVVVGKGVRLVSADGVKWTSTSLPTDEALTWVSDRNGSWICGGPEHVYDSVDGEVWQAIDMRPRGDVVWSDGQRMICTGWPGKMSFSGDAGKTWQPGNELTANGINAVVSATLEAAADQPALDQPALDQSSVDKASVDQASVDQSDVDKASVDKARVEVRHDRRLNLVVIMADDLGYGDLSCYGSTVHQTPNIDRLAEEGVRFTDFYVTTSVCTPTRAAFLTGRFPRRCHSPGVLWPTTTDQSLPDDEITIGELLQDAGYATHLSGKWHLGHGKPEHLPPAHGFDHWYGMPYPNDMTEGHPQRLHRKETWPPMPMMRDSEIVEQPVDVNWLTQQYTADAIDFLSNHHQQPFFLFLAHAMPHAIIGASPDFVGKSKNGMYGDAVQEVDWSTGEIMRTLRSFGLEKNTLVVFTSDNGATHHMAHEPEEVQRWYCADMTSGSNAPLRGGKQATFEGGVRVPGIFRLPNTVRAGVVDPTPSIITDIFPTMLDYLGLPLPKDRVLDGRTIRSVLEGSGGREPNDFMFGGQEVTGIRSGNWKLQLPIQPRWMLPPLESEQPMLFDLANDISERHNVAAANPVVVKQLLSKIKAFEFDCDSTTRNQ